MVKAFRDFDAHGRSGTGIAEIHVQFAVPAVNFVPLGDNLDSVSRFDSYILYLLVGVAGFEPATPSSRKICARRIARKINDLH
jgi:hypothetical protein